MKDNKKLKRKVNFFEIMPPDDADISFEDLLSQIDGKDVDQKRHFQSGTVADEFHQLYMFEKLAEESNLYAGVYMKCSANSITASNESLAELKEESLPEGYRPSYISHFIYSPTTRILAVESGQHAPKHMSLIRYINYMQSVVLKRELTKFVPQAIIDDDTASIIRSYDAVRSIELSITSAELKAADRSGNWMNILSLLSNKGNAGKVSIGISGAKKRGDMTPAFSSEQLASEFDSGELSSLNFGSIRAELLQDEHAVTVNLLQNKIKSDIEVPVYRVSDYTASIHAAIKDVYELNKGILLPAVSGGVMDDYEKNTI
jgi:hypothetical protein